MKATKEPRQAHKAHSRGPKIGEFGAAASSPAGRRWSRWARQAKARSLIKSGGFQWPRETEEDRRQIEEWLAANEATACPPGIVAPSEQIDFEVVRERAGGFAAPVDVEETVGAIDAEAA